MSVCGLIPESMKDNVTCLKAPLCSSLILTRVCKAVDIVIDSIYILIDVLFLPIFDFDVVSSINW